MTAPASLCDKNAHDSLFLGKCARSPLKWLTFGQPYWSLQPRPSVDIILSQWALAVGSGFLLWWSYGVGNIVSLKHFLNLLNILGT